MPVYQQCRIGTVITVYNIMHTAMHNIQEIVITLLYMQHRIGFLFSYYRLTVSSEWKIIPAASKPDEGCRPIIQPSVQVLHYSLPCCSSWLFMSASAGCSLHDAWSAYPACKIHSYKHLNILVMLFTCKVASGSAVVTARMFTNLLCAIRN